ncbi:sensor histidine kinase [Streptomyces sp. NPDC054775]
MVFVEAHPDLVPARAALATMAWTLLPCALLLLALVASLTWYAVGRALRPVETIRAEFAEISAQNLQHRVPVPPSRDEVAVLAVTMNRTLDQLHRAVARLRTFTSDASHELRGPLTTLRVRLELALSTPNTDAMWQDNAREALRDTDRLEEIVADLLLLAKLDANQGLEGTTIRLGAFVREVVADHYGQQGDLIHLSVLDGGDDLVSGSPSALSRVLINLLDNALRHARSRTTISVHGDSKQVTVEIVDDGPGVAQKDRERIFDRFTRLDDARTRDSGGTGLGLAIARDIVVAHGGMLSAQGPRPSDAGGRFVLTLPSLHANSALGPPPPRSSTH